MRGRHQFTIGTHNELFKFRNLFIRDNFGVYEFTGPALFEQGLAQSYSYSFSRTSDPRQAAEFRVYQLGFYAGDQWRVRDDLSLTYGVRLDAPIFPETPAANPLVEQLYGRGTDVVSGDPQLVAAHRVQLRPEFRRRTDVTLGAVGVGTAVPTYTLAGPKYLDA